jgi:hypothetical protein
MKRSDEIYQASEEAAQVLSGTETLRECFVLGAEWADANPASETFTYSDQQFQKLEAELQEAKAKIFDLEAELNAVENGL